MNIPAFASGHSRRASRSESTTSSVSTVKKTVPPLRSGSRTSYRQPRPPSSESIGKHFNTLDSAVAVEQPIPDLDNTSDVLGRSPNLNINRWSHSTSSSLSGIEAELNRPMSFGQGAPLTVPSKPEQLSSSLMPRSQYSTAENLPEPSNSNVSPHKSPARWSKASRLPTAAPTGRFYANANGQNSRSPPAHDLTPDLSFEGDQLTSRQQDYFAGSWEQSRLQSKFGQPIEGIALHYQPGHHLPRKSSGGRIGDGLHQATNSSHIGMQKRPAGRQRDRSENGSKDAAAGSSLPPVQSDHRRTRSHRSPTQKSMLSQALTRANDAVQLDNKQDFQGAIRAYDEACEILEQVMKRSNDPDDRKKLYNIRETYSTRIGELYDLDNSFAHLNEKELPDAPPVEHYVDEPDTDQYGLEEGENGPRILLESLDSEAPRTLNLPPRQESLLPQIFGGESFMDQNPVQRNRSPAGTNLNVPMDAAYMPPPLSPRRPPSPPETSTEATPVATLPPDSLLTTKAITDSQSSESTSWLDVVEDSTSSAPSTRTRLSSVDDGGTEPFISQIEAEFDAALSAAVDAAYEDDDPDVSEATPRPSEHSFNAGFNSNTLLLDSRQDERSLQTQASFDTFDSNASFDQFTREYLDDEAENEEAMNEEAMLELMMEHGFMDDHEVELAPQTNLPRQSDSSSFSARSSGRTWDGSVASTAATNHTALSTLAESPEAPNDQMEKLSEDDESSLATPMPLSDAEIQAQKQALADKQAVPLPSIPPQEKSVPLRDRRLSGQSTQLKIETFTRRASASLPAPLQAPEVQAPTPIPEVQPPQSIELPQIPPDSKLGGLDLHLTPLASVNSQDSLPSMSSATPALTQTMSQPSMDDSAQPLPSPGVLAKMMPPPMRKNTSTTSLRKRNLSLATSASDLDKDTPPTPGSAVFPTESRRGTNASGSERVLPTSSPNVASSGGVGGLYLFENVGDLSRPESAHSSESSDDPLPLEPCPEMFLLRPFWIMRCLYQTLAHPLGGYLTSRLFVPRDIWRVKNVKVKVMEDKVAQCDMLTAALLKLGKVDTFDADAVWEELQSFESILETARVALQKKLGNEVGFGGSASLFKSPTNEEPDPLSQKPSTAKSLASSWRKLRSKSSNAVLTGASNAPGKDKDKDSSLTMPSLPMTKNSEVTTSRSYRGQRHPPPTPTGMQHIGAQQSNYMSSLARLFDAAQVLDSIARQVVDPGLKATSETHVGLEISMRNVAEFFAFFVVRFALQDIGLLMDKYLKRGTEWVTT